MTLPIEQIVARIEQMHARYKHVLQPPADSAALDQLQIVCKSRFGLTIPARYVQLLRITNGVEWNGVVFYGTGSPHANLKGSTFRSVPDETATWWHRRKQLILGNIEDQLFWYDHNVDEYHVWNVSGNEPYRRFKMFDELFAYAFDEGRFYVPNRPPPPDWSSFAKGAKKPENG